MVEVGTAHRRVNVSQGAPSGKAADCPIRVVYRQQTRCSRPSRRPAATSPASSKPSMLPRQKPFCEVYLKLADDPDLASEHETVLRELHSRRIELSRQAGMAALAQWRASRSAGETMTADDSTTATAAPPTPEPEVASETDGMPVGASEPELPASAAPEPLVASASPVVAAPVVPLSPTSAPTASPGRRCAALRVEADRPVEGPRCDCDARPDRHALALRAEAVAGHAARDDVPARPARDRP